MDSDNYAEHSYFTTACHSNSIYLKTSEQYIEYSRVKFIKDMRSSFKIIHPVQVC